MKKILCVTAMFVLAVIGKANTGIISGKTDKGEKKQMRRENRQIRKENWLHSVNELTENQFFDDFPNAKYVSWTEAVFAEATFHDGDIIRTAYYDQEHELVGTTTDVDISVLPAKARHFISNKYPGYKIEKLILFDDNEANNRDMFLFNNSFEDEDNYFPVLAKDSKQIILKVTMNGDVSFFQNYK